MKRSGLPSAVLRIGTIVVATIFVLGAGGGVGAFPGGTSPAEIQHPDAQQQATTVELSPDSVTIGPDETATYEVVVANATDGVGAYDISVESQDPSVVTITDVGLRGDPADQTTNITMSDDGSSVEIQAALADTPNSENVTIATITVTGDTAGSSTLSLTVDAIGTESGQSLAVAEASGAEVTVETASPSTPQQDQTPTATSETASDPVPGFGLTVTLVALLCVVLFVVSRARGE